MEEAIPIGVSQGQTKSPHEVFTVHANAMKDKDELTKEERRKQRQQRKRKIGTHMHKKEIKKKEENRDKGIALKGDRFNVREVQ